MKVDILFLAKNRLEFTRQALAALMANTNWGLVNHIELWDDRSADGTEWELIDASLRLRESGVHATFDPQSHPGSPAQAMNEYSSACKSDVWAKIDNDVIVPPGWLDACAAVMEAHPELDLLGIEPPASRVPHREGMKRSAAPEFDGPIHKDMADKHRWPDLYFRAPYGTLGYAPCDSIGGIGLMRTNAFLQNEPIKPHSTYGGFTEWQIAHPRVRKGWIVPPLKLFLLDRLPERPWSDLSRGYEAKGWQRPWQKYPMSAKDQLWGWWTPVGQEAHAVR